MNKDRVEALVEDVIQASLSGDRSRVFQYLDPELADSSNIDNEIIKPIRRVLDEPNASYSLSFEHHYPFIRALIMTDSKQPLTPVPMNQQIAGLDIVYDDETDKYFITLT
ncbi:hypothetical protein [Macrococcus equipercicus]|uniref:Uncharacterized protein n=1 Tax=Macrococcus equipercicus TaxID=69967 RepID=A0A9Q9BR08_9STAP|nr:hypothetical protein [Macrococcus equipercicus]KAA1039608.1 hypothetical protein ERX35_005910 [Macrococcus equipercicus]UTH13939.1 hypothetical protein KFV11_00770 [Macrococcus equipercicus]